jgi:hypothetical protein
LFVIVLPEVKLYRNALATSQDATESVISDSIRNGGAYKVDRAHFDHFMEDQESNCNALHKLKDDEKADCSTIESVADKAGDCREVRKEIVESFQDRASSERADALKEAVAAESEAKRILDLEKSKNLCN